jgi:conjugal transfer mating pair stabilization protein TraN
VNVRRIAGCLLLGWLASLHALALAAPVEEGKAAGTAANAAVRPAINATDAAANVPGFTATPAEAALYGSPSLSGDAAARMAACALAPTDPTCQAILGARASAGTPRPPVLPTDPSITAARAITGDPASQGVSLTSVYSGCTTRTTLLSPAAFDRQSCFQYLLRSLDNVCRKDLVVTVDWQCPSGASAGPTRNVDPSTGAAAWTCEMPTPRDEAYCVAPLTGPTISTTPPLAGQQVCTDSAGVESAAPVRTVVVTTTVAANPVVTDAWNNGCAGYEARVPPGYLPPDGDNTLPAVLPPMTGPLDRCERRNSVCSIPTETRIISDYPVTRACWEFTNTFDCANLDDRSDCGQPRFGACTADSLPICIDSDATFTPPACTAYRQDFTCRITDPVYRTIEDCGAQSFCAGGICSDASYPPDQDFARAVAFMEAAREAGRYLDPATLRVFKGYDNRCRKKLFGLVNCCNKGGTSARSLFSNYAIASSAVSTLGKAAVSTYTYDALFVSDAPSIILSGFEALWGTGFSSGLAGVLAGDISVSSFIGSLVPGWWTLAILAIQASGILSCPDAEQVVAMKRDASLCTPLGEYCSRRLPIIRTCLEQTQSFCCFNSRLARLINEQGLAQVGRNLGTATSPGCSGFSVAELQALDFSRMDLSEFYAEIAPTAANVGALTGAASAKVPACYFGAGRC